MRAAANTDKKPKRRKKRGTRARPPTLSMPSLPVPQLLAWSAGFVLMLAGIVASGLSLVSHADSMRGVYQQLGKSQQQQDQLLAEHSRLLLERAALSNLHTIEQVARNELDMEFPEELGQVLR